MTFFDLTGETAVVTGAGSGIGEACAHRLASAGAHVVALDVDSNSAGAIAESVGG